MLRLLLLLVMLLILYDFRILLKVAIDVLVEGERPELFTVLGFVSPGKKRETEREREKRCHWRHLAAGCGKLNKERACIRFVILRVIPPSWMVYIRILFAAFRCPDVQHPIVSIVFDKTSSVSGHCNAINTVTIGFNLDNKR